ncbi:putative Phosphoglycolate phosphatase; domain 2 [Paratrimastix pyriformis]|uniref:Phosphoglycolate phosphatase n=1 Tax=Paratrimastix pyriformis TaxID=342808 RepID=A0ABQ8U5V9_9EUKA|nr:putative Phosphoglycolate phosphatase; domain 2 [Paratrimastix pyriformis]
MSSTSTRPTVILFDVDGTLLRFCSCHSRAFHEALLKVLKIDADITEVSYDGCTDAAILAMMMTYHDVPLDVQTAQMPTIMNEMTSYVNEQIQHDEKIILLPGVPTLLQEIRATPGVFMGLTTGNLEPIAHAKLSRLGIAEPFHYQGYHHAQDYPYPWLGGFGSDNPAKASDLTFNASQRRGRLIRGAVERAKRMLGCDDIDVHYFGDTPIDMGGAHEAGVHCLAVATGAFSKEELLQHAQDGDAVLDNLTDSQLVLRLLGLRAPLPN